MISYLSRLSCPSFRCEHCQGEGKCAQAPHSAQLGGARIAWAVQHPDNQELSGGFWTAEPVPGQVCVKGTHFVDEPVSSHASVASVLCAECIARNICLFHNAWGPDMHSFNTPNPHI